MLQPVRNIDRIAQIYFCYVVVFTFCVVVLC